MAMKDLLGKLFPDTVDASLMLNVKDLSAAATSVPGYSQSA